MQQRQPRLGDILDDYCPRERRVTNHAVVAMVGSEVKRTRCATCETEHEYKGAKVPPQRKKKDSPPALYKQVLTGLTAAPFGADQETGPAAAGRLLSSEPAAPVEPSVSEAPPVEPAQAEPDRQPGEEDDPVQRPLIRATLPRTESTAPTRQIPEFTIRQNSGRPGKFRTGAGDRVRPGGGGGGHQGGGGTRHGGRPSVQARRSSNRGALTHHQRPAHHPPHGARVARPGKKRSR